MSFQTYYLREVDVFNFSASMIDLSDIAHHLAMENRFCGATHFPYSVAQHAVMVMELAPEPLRLAALHHDDSEAYMKDLPTALKHHPSMEGYRVAELHVQRTINRYFGLVLDAHKDLYVHAADKEALWHELRSLTRRKKDCKKPYIKMKRMEWHEAKTLYIAAHEALTQGRRWHAVLTQEWYT
jgi:5'-deoxynucleotidase YfbR-like HD superfamily hydrolase